MVHGVTAMNCVTAVHCVTVMHGLVVVYCGTVVHSVKWCIKLQLYMVLQ